MLLERFGRYRRTSGRRATIVNRAHVTDSGVLACAARISSTPCNFPITVDPRMHQPRFGLRFMVRHTCSSELNI